MRISIPLLRLGLATVAFTAGIQSAQAQIAIEPIVGWTWEGQYSSWRVTHPAGHTMVDVDLSPALTVGARLAVLVRSTRFAIAYSRSRPELAFDFDFLIGGENFLSRTFGTRTSRATNQKLALEFAYAGQELPLSLELGGSIFVRTLRVEKLLQTFRSGSRNYDNLGASFRMSIGPESGRWGAPRLAVEVGKIQASGDVGTDFLIIQTSPDPAPHWAPFVMVSGGWRISF
jgi:hypothetical protein